MAAIAPEMRAAHSQSLVQAVQKLPSAEKMRVLDAVGPKALQTIASALPVSWIPMSAHMLLSDSIRDVLGPERNLELWRDTMLASVERPILRGFVSMIVNVFGAEPGAFFKRGGQMHSHLTRGVGTLSYAAIGSGEGRLRLTGFPSRTFNFICYVDGLHGCLNAIFPMTKTTGKIVVEDWDDRRGEVSYLANWGK